MRLKVKCFPWFVHQCEKGLIKCPLQSIGVSDSDGLWNRVKTVYSLVVEFLYNKMCLQIIVWFLSPSYSWLMITPINMTFNNKQKRCGEG